MDSSYSEDFYLSLVEVIQGLCTKFIKFQHFVEVTGYISVEIDNVRKEKYVISELVKPGGNYLSHSYCSHVHVDPKGRSPVGYSSSCVFQLAKLPQDIDERSFGPTAKAAGQKSFPVSFVRPLSTLNSNVYGQPPKVVKNASSSCSSGESKPTQRPSSLNQSLSKPQPLSTSRVQYGSSQNQLMPAQSVYEHASLPPVSTHTQPVIFIDDNEPDIKPVSRRQPEKDRAVGNPVTTGSRLMSVPSNVNQPLPGHPRSAPASRGQTCPRSTRIPNMSGHPQVISGHPRQISGHPQDISGHPQAISGHPQDISRQKRRHNTEPLTTTKSLLMTTSVQGPLVSNSRASTKRAEFDHIHNQSRRSMPIQLACENPPVPKLRRCSDSVMRSKGAGVSTQGQTLPTSVPQQQKSHGPTVATLDQPTHQQVLRRPLIPRPEPVASHRNSAPGLVRVDLKSTCRLPVVQLEPLILPNHLDKMRVAVHVAEGTWNKTRPKPVSTKTCHTPMNDFDFVTEKVYNGIVVQNTHQSQRLQFSPELEKTNLVSKGMPDILSEEAVLVSSRDCEQLGKNDMPLLSPEPRSVELSKRLSRSASEEEEACLFENSDDDDSDLIDADLEEEIYLMQMKEERERAEGREDETMHGAEAGKAASSVPSAVEKKDTPDRWTRSLKTFTKYHVEKSGKEMIDLFSVSPRKMNAMLIEFFKGATKADGRSLSPNTLRYVQLDLQRILNSGGYQYSLLDHAEFQSSRYFLNTLFKDKKNSDAAVRVVNKEEVDILFKEKVLGGQNLISIRNSMWFMTSKYLGLKKRMQVKLKWGDILLKTDKSGKEYIVGPAQGKSTRKAYADAEKGDCCFVHLYKMYRCHRPKSTLDLKSPFYLKVDKKCNQYSSESISPKSVSVIWAMMLAKASLTPGLKVS